MTIRELMKILHKDGWYKAAQRGSHVHMEHPTKPGKVSVPNHNNSDIAKGALNGILRQAGLKK